MHRHALEYVISRRWNS